VKALVFAAAVAGCGACGNELQRACITPDDPPSYIACRNGGGVVMMSYSAVCHYPDGRHVPVQSLPIDD
jgi:hypothetical protein